MIQLLSMYSVSSLVGHVVQEEVVLHVLGPRLESCGTHLHVGLLLWRHFFHLAYGAGLSNDGIGSYVIFGWHYANEFRDSRLKR